MTEPLGDERYASLGWTHRRGASDMGNQFHYFRMTRDNRMLWGGYDAVYYNGGLITSGRDQRPETFALLAAQFFTTFPQLAGLRFSHAWGGVIDTCSRFCAFYGTTHSGRLAYAAGYTGLGVGASRFGANVMLDLLAGEQTERTALAMVSVTLLTRAVATHGAAVHAGDQVQITKLEFRDHTIIVDVNGGGKGKKHFLDHLQISAGGVPTMRSSSEAQEKGPPGIQPGAGSTLFLEFGKAIPDLSPQELKQLLSPFLDFGKQRSASVQWADTLPPDIKKAIQERIAKVGMDREMVVAAVGKPGHKVRERDTDGNEIEDWIYGTPPDRTVFIRFTGDKVTSIKQFPQ